MFFCNFMLAVLDFPSFHIINLKKEKAICQYLQEQLSGILTRIILNTRQQQKHLEKDVNQQGCSFVANEKANKCSHFPWISEKLLRQRSIKFPTTCKKMLTVCVHNSQNSFTKVLPSNKGNNKLLQKINELSSQEKTECVNMCYKRQEDKWNERQYNLWFQLLS